jgi:hypothetical protein
MAIKTTRGQSTGLFSPVRKSASGKRPVDVLKLFGEVGQRLDIEWCLKMAEADARRVLKVQSDSPEALGILHYAAAFRQSGLAAYAFHAGAMHCQMYARVAEPAVVRKYKQVSRLRPGNESRRTAGEENHEAIRREFAEEWARPQHRNRSKRDLCGLLAKQWDGDEGRSLMTITRATTGLKRPGK